MHEYINEKGKKEQTKLNWTEPNRTKTKRNGTKRNRMNACMDGWMNEWMHEWTNERINQRCIKTCLAVCFCHKSGRRRRMTTRKSRCRSWIWTLSEQKAGAAGDRAYKIDWPWALGRIWWILRLSIINCCFGSTFFSSIDSKLLSPLLTPGIVAVVKAAKKQQLRALDMLQEPESQLILRAVWMYKNYISGREWCVDIIIMILRRIVVFENSLCLSCSHGNHLMFHEWFCRRQQMITDEASTVQARTA